MKKPEYTQKVFAVRDRMAAAFMREDRDAMLDILNAARLEWEADGMQREKRALEIEQHQEMEFYRRAEVYFTTRDGLRCRDRVESEFGFPKFWKRPCFPKTSLTDLLSSKELPGIETRVYERQETARDGRPVYVELPP